MIPDRYKATAMGLALAGSAAAFATAGWFANGWRHDIELAELREAHQKERAERAEAAMASFKNDADRIIQAANQYAAIGTTLAPKMSVLIKELSNAKPLPVGCAPDHFRVRNLDAAIDAANQAIPR